MAPAKSLQAMEVVSLCNKLLGIAKLLSNVSDISEVIQLCSSTTLFVNVLETLLHSKLPGVHRLPQNSAQRAENINVVIRELSRLLKTDLSYISGNRVVEGSLPDILDLMDLLAALGGASGGKPGRQGSSNTSSYAPKAVSGPAIYAGATGFMQHPAANQPLSLQPSTMWPASISAPSGQLLQPSLQPAGWGPNATIPQQGQPYCGAGEQQQQQQQQQGAQFASSHNSPRLHTEASFAGFLPTGVHASGSQHPPQQQQPPQPLLLQQQQQQQAPWGSLGTTAQQQQQQQLVYHQPIGSFQPSAEPISQQPSLFPPVSGLVAQPDAWHSNAAAAPAPAPAPAPQYAYTAPAPVQPAPALASGITAAAAPAQESAPSAAAAPSASAMSAKAALTAILAMHAQQQQQRPGTAALSAPAQPQPMTYTCPNGYPDSLRSRFAAAVDTADIFPSASQQRHTASSSDGGAAAGDAIAARRASPHRRTSPQRDLTGAPAVRGHRHSTTSWHASDARGARDGAARYTADIYAMPASLDSSRRETYDSAAAPPGPDVGGGRSSGGGGWVGPGSVRVSSGGTDRSANPDAAAATSYAYPYPHGSSGGGAAASARGADGAADDRSTLLQRVASGSADPELLRLLRPPGSSKQAHGGSQQQKPQRRGGNHQAAPARPEQRQQQQRQQQADQHPQSLRVGRGQSHAGGDEEERELVAQLHAHLQALEAELGLPPEMEGLSVEQRLAAVDALAEEALGQTGPHGDEDADGDGGDGDSYGNGGGSSPEGAAFGSAGFDESGRGWGWLADSPSDSDITPDRAAAREAWAEMWGEAGTDGEEEEEEGAWGRPRALKLPKKKGARKAVKKGSKSGRGTAGGGGANRAGRSTAAAAGANSKSRSSKAKGMLLTGPRRAKLAPLAALKAPPSAADSAGRGAWGITDGVREAAARLAAAVIGSRRGSPLRGGRYSEEDEDAAAGLEQLKGMRRTFSSGGATAPGLSAQLASKMAHVYSMADDSAKVIAARQRYEAAQHADSESRLATRYALWLKHHLAAGRRDASRNAALAQLDARARAYQARIEQLRVAKLEAEWRAQEKSRRLRAAARQEQLLRRAFELALDEEKRRLIALRHEAKNAPGGRLAEVQQRISTAEGQYLALLSMVEDVAARERAQRVRAEADALWAHRQADAATTSAARQQLEELLLQAARDEEAAFFAATSAPANRLPASPPRGGGRRSAGASPQRRAGAAAVLAAPLRHADYRAGSGAGAGGRRRAGAGAGSSWELGDIGRTSDEERVVSALVKQLQRVIRHEA